jgi:CheY-like chemotaxis protein
MKPASYNPLRSQVDLRGVRVLVVEDDHDSRDVLRRIVEAFGATVRTAESGHQGLLRACVDKPDLILCDLRMPGMDGYAFMGRLRANPALARVAVIAVTALGNDRDFQRTWEAGFDGHLVKPIDCDVIAAQLARVLWPRKNRPNRH